MSQDHPSKLTFSVEESVWLNKGQEIDEILAMSLEPEITIQENHDHVSIRGGLQLSGEYRPTQQEESLEVEEGSLRDQVSFRSIEQVSVSDDGIATIKHHFPIDVTIPLNRINNLDDIYVLVESFDYDLPERGCIQLTADVSISGMTNEQRAIEPKPAIETVAPVENHEVLHRNAESFHFEARKSYEDPVVEVQQDPVTLEETGTDATTPLQPQPEPVVASEVREEALQAEQPKPVQEEERPPAEAMLDQQEPEVPKTPQVEMNPRREDKEPSANDTKGSFSSYFTKTEKPTEEERPEDPVEEVVAQEEERPQEVEEDNKVVALKEETGGAKINLALLKKIAEDRPEQNVASLEEEGGDVEQSTGQTEGTRREENALYLTKMLTKGEEEFSRMKMCIIQGNESLDTIAQRYELTPSQLVRANRLDDENVSEGQIIYIPVTSSS